MPLTARTAGRIVNLGAELGATARALASRQRWSRARDLVLESGSIIRGCRLGYRTFGELDASRSNVVLLLPWFMGRSLDLARQVGPGRLVDTRRYFVVAVDNIGNGVSSSPSNTRSHPAWAFPAYTLPDLVEAQRRLLEELRLPRLHAVVGISFGGMQAFSWLVTHPTVMSRAVAIVASPRLEPHERSEWLARAAADRNGSRWSRAASALGRGRPREAVRELRDASEDLARQAEALASTDVSLPFAGSLEAAARAAQARLMVVVSEHDPIVNPLPAREFARLTQAELLVLPGRCGHDAPSCERNLVWPAIDRFLAA